tara:strand:+ start:339 stop:587 length:249 start_codon:yes stop_codon:yes gene_type:complete
MVNPIDAAFTILKATGYGTNYEIKYCPVCSEDTYHTITYDDVERQTICDSCGLPDDDITMSTPDTAKGQEELRRKLWELHNQ